jgi:SAM-dependent methyltransferase
VARYARDLAWIHHAGFSGPGRHAARFLLGRLRRGGRPGGTVVDLGCGTGAAARVLRAGGYDVVGFDGSAAMLALARAHARGARFRRSSLWAARLPPCVAVLAFGECLNYEARGMALLPLFRRVRRALAPGGLFVFDLREVAARGEAVRVRAGPGWAVAAHSARSRRRLTRRIVFWRRRGGRWRRGEEVHRLRLWPRREVRAALARAGFEVEVVRAFGRARLSGTAGYVARALR